MERRDLLRLLATIPLGAWSLTPGDVLHAANAVASGDASRADADGQPEPFTPEFFNPLEWRTVRVLSDLVIPADERSGSATDAGVPEFMDFIMTAYPGSQRRMREGLGWLNAESRERFGAAFPDATDTRRRAILDDIAWPRRAAEEHAAGVRFFNAFRDLCASGFWTSRMGVADIGYEGNKALAAWTGCPPAVHRHLGLPEA